MIRDGPFEINANLLKPDTTYQYQLTAANALGTSTSEVRSFTTPAEMTVEEIAGDLVITEDTKRVNTHLRIHGNLRLQAGTLTLNGCVAEMMSRYSREHGTEWSGGTLVTNCTTVGGTQREGVIAQGRFDLVDGAWIATDTTVRYTYGIVFGLTKPLLYATRLIQGPNPDSIIMGSSNADVVLRDSRYNVSLYTDSSQGADGRLDLPEDTAFSRVFDESNVPGAKYRIEVVDSAVPWWWVFFGGIEEGQPESEIVLGDCPFFIPSIIARNLRGTVRLPVPWPAPGKTNTTLKVGNLTLRTEDKPVRTHTWGIYLSGGETDVTFAGPTKCCEFMVWGGKVRFEGTPGTGDSVQACTTVDIHGDAEVSFRNATFSTSPPTAPILPQITVDGTAKLIAEDSLFGKVRLFARDGGTMHFTNTTSRNPANPVIGEGADKITMISAPSIVSVPNPRAVVGEPYSYALDARLAQGAEGEVSLSAPHDLPAWLSFDADTGVLSGTPRKAATGEHRITLRASANDLDREQSFVITVDRRAVASPALASIPGLLLHLDAACSEQIDDGASVATWFDLSGNGHHATAIAGVPTLAAEALDGVPATHFPGGAVMSCGDLREGVGGMTLFVVSQSLGEPSPDLWPRLACAHPLGGVPWEDPGFQMMAPLHEETHRGVSHPVRIDALTSSAKSLANFHVASDGITDQYYVGDIFEVIVYGRALSDDELVTVDDYLTGKYPTAR